MEQEEFEDDEGVPAWAPAAVVPPAAGDIPDDVPGPSRPKRGRKMSHRGRPTKPQGISPDSIRPKRPSTPPPVLTTAQRKDFAKR